MECQCPGDVSGGNPEDSIMIRDSEISDFIMIFLLVLMAGLLIESCNQEALICAVRLRRLP
jgi:hypothetical protein